MLPSVWLTAAEGTVAQRFLGNPSSQVGQTASLTGRVSKMQVDSTVARHSAGATCQAEHLLHLAADTTQSF